jgi:nuclear GTP-binding protein
LTEVFAEAQNKSQDYVEKKQAKDRSVVKGIPESRPDLSQNRVLMKKGQSSRIWNELYKVVDSADVLLYVVDARDPMGTRSPFLEDYMRREKKFKHFVFVLNKCDLVPLWVTARWLQILSKDYPTIAFHASVNHPFGKGNLISILRQFAKLHNVTHRGSKQTKTPISVGIVGYPNVGKSSVINTLRRKSVCKVAPIPGETKVWQYVALTRSIFLIDCPGVVYDKEGNNDVQAVLKGVVRIERLGSADKTDVVNTVLQIVKKKDIVATYNIYEWRDVNDFLDQLAKLRGKLGVGGAPDADLAARMVLYDWQRGKIPWFNAPPFDSNQQYRETLAMPEDQQLKIIEHYSSFNVVQDRIEHNNASSNAVPSAPLDAENDDDEHKQAAEAEEHSGVGDSWGAADGDDDMPTSSPGGSHRRRDTTLGEFMELREEATKKKLRQERRRAKNERARASSSQQPLGPAPAPGHAAAGPGVEGDEDDLWNQFVTAAATKKPRRE